MYTVYVHVYIHCTAGCPIPVLGEKTFPSLWGTWNLTQRLSIVEVFGQDPIDESGQFITTFPAGWSPQMVVKCKGIPSQNGLKLG